MNTSNVNKGPLCDEILSINSRVDTFLKLKAIYQEKEVAGLMGDLDKITHIQFLMDVNNLYGEEIFKSLKTAVEKGNEYYEKELYHLVPNHQEIFDASRRKVIYEEKFCILQKINDSKNDGVIMTALKNLWFFVPFGIWVYTLTEWFAGWEISPVLINASIAGVIVVIIIIYLKLSK